MRRALYLSVLAFAVLAVCRPAAGQVSIGVGVGDAAVGISVGFAPPPIPEYEQPECPEDGAIWVPGYWAWDDDDADYYWVPGTWVMAPEPGLLWTPAYWAWDDDDGGYRYHDGYWAPEVGFYGGINYGYGYYGNGFAGGRWDHDRFMYNTAVLHVNETVVHNVYVDRTVVVNETNVTRVSYNGGQGGTTVRPTERQQQVAQERHFPPAQAQMQNRQEARTNPELRASSNQGRPPVAATARPGDFHGHVVAAQAAGGGWHPPADRREAAKPHANAQGGRNARPGEIARPQVNACPGENAPNESARPKEVPRPNENPRPALPQARPNENPRPNESPRPAMPQARPNENRRPETPQTRPSEPPPNPHSESHPQPQARPQPRPAEPPRAEPKPETKPKEHPPQQ